MIKGSASTFTLVVAIVSTIRLIYGDGYISSMRIFLRCKVIKSNNLFTQPVKTTNHIL